MARSWSELMRAVRKRCGTDRERFVFMCLIADRRRQEYPR